MLTHRLLYANYSRYLANSTAFVQNGPKIREVPLVVRRILDESRKPQTIPRAHTLIDKRLIERIEALSSNSSLIQLLETLKYSQVTPQIATLSLTKMSEFKDEYNKEGFASSAFIKRLLDIIVSGVEKDSTSLIEGLSLGVLELENLMDPLDAISFRRKMFEAALISMTDGVLKPCEIAKTVCIISEYFPDRGAKFRETDKFWPGIMDKSEEINSKNISTVCKALPHLKKSRDIVMKTIEYKLDDCYRDLDTSSALEVLGILTGIGERNRRILDNLSDWISLNIQKLSEKELLAFIYCFTSLEFTSLTFERTLERYMKAKGVRIKDIELISSICEYAFKFRLRNLTILEGVSEYFISHGKKLTPSQIHSVVRIFGELNYHPPNGFKFFENLENLLDNKFHEFDPMEILNILVGAVYLEVYPLNFVDKVFSKDFFTKCSNLSSPEKTEVDNLLRILESGIRVGVKGYERFPIWRSNSYQYVNRNFRVGKAAKKIMGPLGEIVGGLDRLNLDVILSSLPLTPIYIIDLMIYPSAAAKFTRLGKDTKNNMVTAVIIHPSEHYDSKGQHLIGIQAHRIRHLKQMNFKVMELSMKKLYHMSRSESENLKSYLKQCYEKSECC